MSSLADPPADGSAAEAVGAMPFGQATPPMVSAEHAELQRQGAKAAARGEASESNPMFDSINQPAVTGESKQAWSGRREAWERGHSSQMLSAASLVRSNSGSTTATGNMQDEALYGVTQVMTFEGFRALSSASGFFFEHEERLFLVTSRHVLFDAPAGHAPDRIEIGMHTDENDLTQWATLSILLHRAGVPVWHHARDIGGEVDVAVLELDRTALPAGCIVRAFGADNLPPGFDQFEVGDRLAIPGFPLGFFDAVHHLPVVRQASVASSFGVRFQGLGYFLTDARMHRGSSGSPVLARVESLSMGGPRWRLLGIHSSRMDMATRDATQDESLGLNVAWYADVLMALTTGASHLHS